MIKSVFIDGSVCYGVNYSYREDCISVEEITDEQYRIETTPPVVEETVVEETVVEETVVEETLSTNELNYVSE
jgi:hypothetical protein